MALSATYGPHATTRTQFAGISGISDRPGISDRLPTLSADGAAMFTGVPQSLNVIVAVPELAALPAAPRQETTHQLHVSVSIPIRQLWRTRPAATVLPALSRYP